MLHFRHSKIHPNLRATAQLAYIVTDADCDYGRLFNVFIRYLNVSMTCPILVYWIVAIHMAFVFSFVLRLLWTLMVKNFVKHNKTTSPKWTWTAPRFSIKIHLYVCLGPSGCSDTKWYHYDLIYTDIIMWFSGRNTDLSKSIWVR